MTKLASVFVVTNYRTLERVQVTMEGAGDATIRALRKEYPSSRYKHVLDSFIINGNSKFLTL